MIKKWVVILSVFLTPSCSTVEKSTLILHDKEVYIREYSKVCDLPILDVPVSPPFDIKKFSSSVYDKDAQIEQLIQYIRQLKQNQKDYAEKVKIHNQKIVACINTNG